MLYDPKWEVKADPLSLDSLIAWLEKQPATVSYDFYCAGECLLGQWVRSIDPKSVVARSADNPFCYFMNGRFVDLEHFEKIANGGRGPLKWTFGDALSRARAAHR